MKLSVSITIISEYVILCRLGLVGTEVKRSLSMSMVLGSMPQRVVELMC